MFKLSRNLKAFGVLAVLYSLVFNYYYSGFVTESQWSNVAIAATLYFIGMFATGLILGAKDPIRISRIDQGFHYHFVTYVVVNTISVLWTLLGFSAEADTVGISLLTAFSWGVALLVHFLVVRHMIKGIPRDEVFE